ncbi:MAG TPA: pyridoxal-phosphate dependent enzyme [Euzebyales bacterium]|nr:pyridoxal-phosphate dependent enzyme [Euzebyales bacterium]
MAMIGRERTAAVDVLTTSPRVSLAHLPTPLHRAAALERALGCPPLYVKRDDLTGFAFGGNKARTLEYLIGAARAEGCDVLITGGGPSSAHCMTAAMAARVVGMACVLVCFGEPPASRPAALALALAAGARVRFTGDDDRASIDHQLDVVAAEERASGRHPAVVPRGGATVSGSLAYAAAVPEVSTQLSRLGVEPDLHLLATGSCGTQAGLVAGTIAMGAGWRVIGASVSRPVDECVERVTALATACTQRLGVRPPMVHEVIVVDARGPGFGRTSAAGRRCARLAAATEGLVLDDVYTAKALAQLPTVARSDAAVFWHTGGTVAAVANALSAGEEQEP